MKKIYYPIIFLISLLQTSCLDLTLEPRNTITNAIFWKLPQDFEKAANELYFGLDFFPKDSYAETMSGLSLNNVSNGTFLATENDGVWNSGFAYLRLTNSLLKNCALSDIKDAINTYKGEALFFRAFFYFGMYQRFGALPIVRNELDLNSPELMGSRNSRVEVEDFILADLDEAITLLPNVVSNANKGRITKGAALAFKSRVALFIGTWAKYHQSRTDYNNILAQAIDASEKIITGSGTDGKKYNLYNGKGLESYRYLFIEEGDDSQESILDNRYFFNIRTHGNTYGWTWGTVGFPTKTLADSYLCDDGLPIDKSAKFQGYEKTTSEYNNRDPRMNMTFIKPGKAILTSEVSVPFVPAYSFSARPETKSGYRSHKFISEKRYTTGSSSCEYDCHVIRYGEVLLNYIEAKFEKAGMVSNDDLNQTINLLRARVGMPAMLSNEFVNANGLSMQNEIRRERTVELALEGFRHDDLRRWKIAETEMPKALRGVKIKGTEWETKILTSQLLVDAEGFLIIESAANRTFDKHKHYLFPLPMQQLSMNPNLKPNNPGWE